MSMPVIDEENEIFNLDMYDAFAIIREESRKIIVNSTFGTFKIPYTINEIATVMEPHGFFQINQTHIINVDQIKAFKKGYVYIDGTRYKVSKRRQEALAQLIEKRSRDANGKNCRHPSTDNE